MGEVGTGSRVAAPSQRLHVPMASLPDRLFTPSESLAGHGWPDFSVRSLADWSSSTRPAPDTASDCCVVLCYWRMAPADSPSAEWTFLLHETGGIWDERKRLLARRLEIGERGTAIAHAIARAMAQSNRSASFAEFDALLEYRNLLNQFGLDCNHHIQAMAEGLYPIDLTEEAWAILDVLDAEAYCGEQPHLLCLAVLAPNVSEW